MVTHGGADRGGGRANDSSGPTNSGVAGGPRGWEGEPMSQVDTENPEGQGGADGSGNRGGDPEGSSGAGATEDQGGAGGKEETDRATGTEGWGAAGGVESRGSRWSTTDQGRAGGTMEPGGAGRLMSHHGEEGARSRWVNGPRWSPGLRGWRQTQEILETLRRWRLADPWLSHHTDGGLRGSRGDDGTQQWQSWGTDNRRRQ